MKPLSSAERQLAESAARLLEVAGDIGLPDTPDKLGVTPRAFVLIARAYVELLTKVRALHDAVELTNPKDPVGIALTSVGLERRPDRAAIARPRLVVKTAAEVEKLSSDDLLAIYCCVMGEVTSQFRSYASYVVRAWDGMDGCWTDCTGEVGREEALRYWAERTGGGAHHVTYAEIDYYRIFPGGTNMLWDGSEGREMHR